MWGDLMELAGEAYASLLGRRARRWDEKAEREAEAEAARATQDDTAPHDDAAPQDDVASDEPVADDGTEERDERP